MIANHVCVCEPMMTKFERTSQLHVTSFHCLVCRQCQDMGVSLKKLATVSLKKTCSLLIRVSDKNVSTTKCKPVK